MAALCRVDGDCPGPFVCYANVSWAEEEAQCLCSSWYGRMGERCDELGPMALFHLFVSGGMATAGGTLCLLALWDLGLAMATFGSKFSLNASNSTLLLSALALASFTVWQVVYLLQMLIVWDESNTEVNNNGEKDSDLAPIVGFALVFAQTFAFLACLNVSVMWVEFSQRAEQMTTRVATNITRYRRACLVSGVLFLVLVMGITFSSAIEFTLFVTLPFVLATAALFILGRIRMVGLLSATLSNGLTAGPNGAPRGQKSMAERTERTIRAIKVCSTRVIAALCGIVVAGTLYFLAIRLPEGGWRALSPPGEISVPVAVGSLLPLSILMLNVSIFVYCHRTTSKLVRRARGRGSTQPVPPGFAPGVSSAPAATSTY